MTEQNSDSLQELQLESRLGGAGTENAGRTIPVIDLADFDSRREEITRQLWRAAVEDGFFQLANHGIGRGEEVDTAFADAADFFRLPESVKSRFALRSTSNAGWESRAQVRPSTQSADQKESFQITRSRMEGLWPDEAELPGFRDRMLAFERQCWQLGMKVLSCFADQLGFERDFFTRAHDPEQSGYQSTLRLLHYFAAEGEVSSDQWRAGAHTDFDCLTLLFQREGQAGLQVCPGREAESMAWTPVVPRDELITCNIGDMLMRWSDDQLRSTLHRVRMPAGGEPRGARQTLAFFCQANSDQVIRGPGGKYPPITARDYLRQRIAANFSPSQSSSD